MIQSLYNAASGMQAQQKNIDTIANNVANVDTAGYKKTRADFKDAIYNTMVSPVNGAGNLQQGNGVLAESISRNFREAPAEKTEGVLDFSITGDGFFAVENDGGRYFTRDGNFKVSAEGNDMYLVTSRGEYVLDSNLNKIKLDGSIEKITADSRGNIETESGRKVQLGVFVFPNAPGLYAAGNNNYEVSPSSGAAQLRKDPEVRQFFLESSNVDLTEEMTGMIRAQRAYQAAARALTTADEMEATANNIRT